MAENKKTEGLNLQPQALEAEEAVLGSMMIDEDAANKAVSILGSSHYFYKDSHKKIFEAKKNDRIVLMTTKASKIYTEFKFRGNDTLLFGRESAGVPKNIHHEVDKRIKIPLLKKKRSLNLSTTVSMVVSKLIL